MTEETPQTPAPATEAGRQAAGDPTRQRPLDAGGATAAQQAHGEAIAASAAEQVARREADQAQQQADAAHAEIERLSRKERKAREKAEREREKAEAEHRHAEEAERREQGEAMARAAEADLRPASGPAPAPAATPDEKPEILVGAAFAGAFLFAKLLKRIANR